MKKMVIGFLFIAGMLQIATAGATQQGKNGFKVLRVAHAGGGINRTTYTNSYDALNLNLKKGFKYFEIDFSYTVDNQLVCLHDWKDSFKRSFGFFMEKKPTLAEFKQLVQEKSKFKKCTLDGLAVWMKENPSAYIITDIKPENRKFHNALRIIAETLPDSLNRVIPQIYYPKQIKKVKKLGFKQIIWTLYRYAGDDAEVLAMVDTLEPPIAVTMPHERGLTALPKKLQEKGVPSYVHTINVQAEKNLLLNICHVAEIYTDFLAY